MAKPRILVVDDESIVAEDIKDRLVRVGYDVVAVAYTAADAMRQAEKLKPDLVLMDIMLKEGADGITAAGQIGRTHNIPLIYLTAYSDEKTLERAKSTNPYGYLLKPFDERELRSAIETALNRHELEMEVVDARERLSLALKSSGMGRWSLEIGEDRRYFDERTCRLLGLDPASFTGKADEFYNLVHPDDRETVKKAMEKTMSEDAPYEPDYRAIWPDGSVHNIKAHARLYRDQEGKPLRITGLIEDITRRKEAENLLKYSEKRFQDIAFSSGDWIWEVDAAAKYTFVSEGVKKILGYDPAEIIGRTPLDLMPQDEAKRIGEAFGKIASEKRPIVDLVNWNLAKDGSRVCLLTNGVPLFDEKGGLAGYRGIDKDITERILLEEALRESEKKFKTIFDSANDGMFLVDLETRRFMMCNRSCHETLGYTEGEFLALDIRDLHVPEELPFIFEQIDREVRGEEVERRDIRFKRKGGGIIYADINPSMMTLNEKRYVLIVFKDITERRGIEEALRKSESQLSNAAEMAHLGPWEYDVLKDTFTFNDSFYRIFRTSAKEVGGYTMSSAEYAKRFVHPEDMFMVGAETRKAIETDDPNFTRQIDHRILYADGKMGYIAVRFFIVKDEHGRTIRTYGVNQDITERKRAEEALRKREEEFSLLVNTAPSVITRVKADGAIMFVNDAGARMVGVASGDLIGKRVQDLFPPAIAERQMEMVRKVVTSGVGGSFDTESSIGGRRMWFNARIEPLRDASGNVDSALVVVTDLTDRIEAENTVKASKDYIERVVNTIPDPVFVKDEEHRWVSLNDAYCRFMGYGREELIGKSDRDFFPKDEADVSWMRDDAVLKSGADDESEEQFTDKAGTVHTIVTKRACYTDADGEKYIVGVIRDVTDIKRMEDDMKRKLAELEKFTRLTVGREERIIELKNRVKELESKADGQGGKGG